MGLSLLPMCIIWGVILPSGYSKGRSRDNVPTVYTSSFMRLNSEPLLQNQEPLFQNQGPLLPTPYLQLPVFQHSRVPLVAKEHFSPLRGKGHEKLPDDIRDILKPVFPQVKEARHSGGPRGIVIQCKVNKMEVRVPKRLLGSEYSRSHLAFGTCQPNNFTKHYLSFVYDVNECGSNRSVGAGTRRVAYRFHYSYKIGYQPKVETQKVFKHMTSKSVYTLTPFDAQWKKLNLSDWYAIGRPMYFEAEGPPLDRDGRLYIHSCHVTPNESHSSKPIFTVIDNFGCMIDSKSSIQSGFISYTRTTVRFSVDAFVFQGVASRHLFMHCEMSTGSVTPTESDKSCSYNRERKRWEELQGLDSVCSCCESTCLSPPTAAKKMVSSGAWSVESDGIQTSKMKSPLWPEEEGPEPEIVQGVVVTEMKHPTGSAVV
ncbi:zona pellucida sperm-binding protein 3-like isoform X2 [Clupea harengus]|uniref:Zona pellucida sperm-binding protein 3-like isoform X2 n=1 Tax=Clupea harengus TaxID=7950 RepID=A0A6P8FYV9_CLUHA|nr:zona pellucida sperm-binding protein 3-like isoform X2 [Clupea harengus]